MDPKILQHAYDARADVVLGAPAGSVEVVWYLDYASVPTERQRGFLSLTFEDIGGEDTLVVVRPYGRGKQGRLAARALVAAGNQGPPGPMHRALLAEHGDFSPQALIELAGDQGLDVDRFAADLTAETTAARIADNGSHIESLGSDKSGLYIDGRQYDGVWDNESVLEAIRKPFGYKLRVASQDFFHWAASAGLVLLVATVAALLCVNAGLEEPYERLRETVGGLRFGGWSLELTLEQWVNDGMMAVFFLLVGLEIKREIVSGELSSLSNASLPVAGAVGGVLVPALVYVAFNWGEPTVSGWGIPMATDIAFTLGLMALLGSRVPASLMIFVAALTIADDLLAIVVIAIFYGHGIQVLPLLYAFGVLVAMGALNVGRVYRRVPYLLLGALLWYFVFQSGVHATLAGVLTAMAIPSRKRGSLTGVAAQASAVFATELAAAKVQPGARQRVGISARALDGLQEAIERLRAPGFHLQQAIEPWTNFLILPLFAFVNMGVVLHGAPFQIAAPESLGVLFGLAIGKPLGIVAACWLAVKLGIAELADGIGWPHLVGAGCLAGVGFTMSIFIASAAFEGQQLQGIKVSILIASAISAAAGTVVLLWASRTASAKGGGRRSS